MLGFDKQKFEVFGGCHGNLHPPPPSFSFEKKLKLNTFQRKTQHNSFYTKTHFCIKKLRSPWQQEATQVSLPSPADRVTAAQRTSIKRSKVFQVDLNDLLIGVERKNNEIHEGRQKSHQPSSPACLDKQNQRLPSGPSA